MWDSARFWHHIVFLDTHPVDITRQWQGNWKSALVANCSQVDYPAIWQPEFNLLGCHWSLINCFWTNQGHFVPCRKKVVPCKNWQVCIWQTMLHIISGCPQTKLEGDLLRLKVADSIAVQWLTTRGL